ncbi:MAG: glycosyltransferase family 2 protein [Rhizobiaceae bacterium]
MLHRDQTDFAGPPLPEDVTLVGTSADLRPERFEVVITLPTFRRPEQVVATLNSLALQKTMRPFAVIVIENDSKGRQGAASAMERLAGGNLPGLVIIGHRRGNCEAYNAGWAMAVAYFPSFKHLLVIDDDEVASPDWLEQMCSTAERFGADVVGGPVLPIFPGGVQASQTKHPIFTPHYDRTALVPRLYGSGNLLATRQLLLTLKPPYFDPRFNFIGGGDSDLLSRIAVMGFKLAWCQEAVAHETVPARRLEADWIRARSLRNGVISTLVEQKKRAAEPAGRLLVFAKSLALLAASPFRALAQLIRGRRPASAVYPIYVALGRVFAEFGYANEQYRNPEKN